MNNFESFIDFLKKNENKLNKKVQVSAKYEEVKNETKKEKELDCSLFFSFYMNGGLVNVGAFVSFTLEKKKREIKNLSIKNNKSPFLTDESAIPFNEDELKIIIEDYIKPYFRRYILEGEIEYLDEMIVDSLNPSVFK